jgi:hypothetical protein
MQVADALKSLGVDRVIWIDDLFNQSAPDLADMLLNSYEVALDCGFEDIAPILRKREFGEEGLREELSERLTDLGPLRKDEIRKTLFAQEVIQKMFATAELSDPAVERICQLLNIAEADRWNFEKATADIPALCDVGDAPVAYVVDLNDTGKSSTAGLAILELLYARHSKGTAFILTHEADKKGEVKKEAELRDRLTEDNEDALAIPMCVIAKQRLLVPDDDGDVEEDLRVAVKRAGLRKSLSEVVYSAKNVVAGAFKNAAMELLSVPPEQLEEHVFERGYKEGVSELHVVERILTSQIAQKLRIFFGTDDAVLTSALRLRELKGITLEEIPREADANLSAFRLAEVWESNDLINRALTPIACGDVFETDAFEKVPGKKRMFVLLAQPCDIALRPAGKSRRRDTAFLVPLSNVIDSVAPKNKDFVLPCKLEDQYWECDFGETSPVRLDILDLASFREDGRVRVDIDHAAPKNLFPSQSHVYGKRTRDASKALTDGTFIGEKQRSNHPSLQLAFSYGDDFKQYCCAQLRSASRANALAKIPAMPKRITWQLIRSGRVRMPYAAALLDHYLSGMSRHAFDMDYMSPGQKPRYQSDRSVDVEIPVTAPVAPLERPDQGV